MDGPRLERAPTRATPAVARPAWRRRLLGVPLAAKLAGANLLLALAGSLAVLAAARSGRSQDAQLALAALFLLAALVVTLTLVHLALRPLVALERTAERISRGDLAARVPRSPLADANLARIGDTLNRVLDGLTSDRARLRRLAAEVIRAGDEERARIARELHDSTAQTLAALKLQLAALGHGDPALAGRLAPAAALAADALEEVRTLAHVVYPRVLDDLGLPAALEWLARHVDGPVPEVEVPDEPPPLGREEGAVLYRVAQEALRNAARHAGARTIRVALTASDSGVTLAVTDDGAGFDPAEAEQRRPGMGLFTMRERVGLVNGRLTIASDARGTRVEAWVPLAHAPRD